MDKLIHVCDIINTVDGLDDTLSFESPDNNVPAIDDDGRIEDKLRLDEFLGLGRLEYFQCDLAGWPKKVDIVFYGFAYHLDGTGTGIVDGKAVFISEDLLHLFILQKITF